MSMLMIPVVLTYTVIWFVDNQSKPPSENLIIEWSVRFGPYPMRVQCVEARLFSLGGFQVSKSHGFRGRLN